MPEALRVDGLHVERGTRSVVRGVRFSARHGEFLAIVGPNGAGKSTLLKAVAGLLPFGGSVTVDGRSLAALSVRERARHMAYVPQEASLRAHLDVRAVVAQGRHAHHAFTWRGPDLHEPAVDRALAATDLTCLADRSFLRLSGGERRRVLLARAVATEARIILLDEPTAGLDVAQVLRFHALLRQLVAQGTCVVSVMHDLNDVRQVADRVLLLRAGESAAYGPVDQVIAPGPVADVYAVGIEDNASFRFFLQEPSP